MPSTAAPSPQAPTRHRGVGAQRLSTAALCAVALVFRFEWGLGTVTFEPANFFAYLTIQSNIAYVLVTVIAGVLAWRGSPMSRRFDTLRAGVLTCTVTAGLVFAVIVLQSTSRGIRVDVPWSDVVLHFVLPVVALADWLLTARSRTPKRVVLVVLGYVGVWGGLTMFRGSVTGWYPYYFLDPSQTNSPAEFLLLSGAAITVFAVIGLLVTVTRTGLSRWPEERTARDSPAPSRAARRRLHQQA